MTGDRGGDGPAPGDDERDLTEPGYAETEDPWEAVDREREQGRARGVAGDGSDGGPEAPDAGAESRIRLRDLLRRDPDDVGAGGGPGEGRPALDDVLRSVMPAALVALAEGGVLFLAVRLFVEESVASTGGPLVSYPAFLALFVVGVAAGAAFRRLPALPAAIVVAATALGVLQATRWGSGEAAPTMFTVILSLGVGLRAVTLAFRDWRNPASGGLGWGAAVLLLLVMIGSFGGFDDLLPVVVPVFFLGHLASRAAIVWLYAGTGPRARRGGGRAARMAAIGLVGLLALFLLVALLGGRGGGITVLGRLLDPIVGLVVGVVVFVMVQLARPLLWLADRIGIDPEGVRLFFERLQRRAAQRDDELIQRDSGPERLIGLVVLLLLAVLIVWLIQRQRDRLRRATADAAGEEEPAERRDLAPPARPRRRVRAGRRELPENVVRRWYAEALIALEGLGVPRASWATPAEYLEAAAAAYPAVASDLGALTRAYEDVRYGGRGIDRDALRRLQPRVGSLMAVLSRAEPLEGKGSPGGPAQ
jgi:Domain of unknown function (DUF4129)